MVRLEDLEGEDFGVSRNTGLEARSCDTFWFDSVERGVSDFGCSIVSNDIRALRGEGKCDTEKESVSLLNDRRLEALIDVLD